MLAAFSAGRLTTWDRPPQGALDAGAAEPAPSAALTNAGVSD